MIDFNSSASISGADHGVGDAGIQRARASQSQREYLGGSRLGTS